MTWTWLSSHLAIAWHAQLVERFGGAPGVRDVGLLERALACPRNLVAYEVDVTVEHLAALYGIGLSKAHAFVDGNERVAFAAMVAFLKAHDRRLDTTEAAATAMMLDATTGVITERMLEEWLRSNCRSG